MAMIRNPPIYGHGRRIGLIKHAKAPFVVTGAVIDVRAEFLGDGLGILGVSAGRDLNRVRRRASCPLVEPPPTPKPRLP